MIDAELTRMHLFTKIFKDGAMQDLPWSLFAYGIRLFGRIGWTAFVPHPPFNVTEQAVVQGLLVFS